MGLIDRHRKLTILVAITGIACSGAYGDLIFSSSHEYYERTIYRLAEGELVRIHFGENYANFSYPFFDHDSKTYLAVDQFRGVTLAEVSPYGGIVDIIYATEYSLGSPIISGSGKIFLAEQRRSESPTRTYILELSRDGQIVKELMSLGGYVIKLYSHGPKIYIVGHSAVTVYHTESKRIDVIYESPDDWEIADIDVASGIIAVASRGDSESSIELFDFNMESILRKSYESEIIGVVIENSTDSIYSVIRDSDDSLSTSVFRSDMNLGQSSLYYSQTDLMLDVRATR